MVFDPRLADVLYDRSIAINVLPPTDAYAHHSIIPSPYYSFAGRQWVWDIPYSGWTAALVGNRPDLAREFVRGMVSFQLDDGPDAGMIPLAPKLDGILFAAGISQAPLLCWLTLQLHRLDPDPAFVKDMYPALARWVRWWRSPRRDFDRDGLSEYAGPDPSFVAWESGIDYGPDKDLLMRAPLDRSDDGLFHDPLADVTLNSFLYAELEALAELAAELAPDEVSGHRAEADRIRTAMNEAMWDEEVGAFFPCVRRDLVASRPRHFRVTPLVMMPLWAGLATDEQARRTIDLIRGMPSGYPTNKYPIYEGAMDIRLGSPDDFFCGYQVVTPGLHPAAGEGEAAGGIHAGDVRKGQAGWTAATAGQLLRCEWPSDRAVREAWIGRMLFEVDATGPGNVQVTVTDSDGDVFTSIDGEASGQTMKGGFGHTHPTGSIHGIAEIEVRADAGVTVRSVRLHYSRSTGGGLLGAYGVRSAHPLDGKFPARGAPTQFWSGTIWGPYVWHACHAMARYGEDVLARAVAKAYCEATERAFAAGGTSFEFLSPWDGTGMGAADYTWGAGCALLLDRELLGD